jgi:hypothetical protein
MNAMATLPEAYQNYLVRVQGTDLVFAPITSAPHIRNFYLLETCEKYKYSKAEGKFIPSSAQGTLFLKKGETKQKLEGFRAATLTKLLEKIAQRVSSHYLNNS